MRRAALTLSLLALGCSSSSSAPPPCGSGEYAWHSLLPGPAEPGHDAVLAARARKYDRQFLAISSFTTGLNADVSVALDQPEARQTVERFLTMDDGFDLAAFAGKPTDQIISAWGASVGLYGGAGAAADAYRYGVLRDQGGSCADLDGARQQLVRAMTGMHQAATIGGTPGILARAIASLDFEGDARTATVTPLKNTEGMPLPLVKNNGAWRTDLSGKLPNLLWIDSLSRDMMVGWAMAWGAVFEVGRDDPTMPAELLASLKEDAAAITRALMKVAPSGFDLEIPDADGRSTLNGRMNEYAFEQGYLPGPDNGFYAGMALGIVGAFASVARDPEIDAYLQKQLIETRNLPKVVSSGMLEVDLGAGSNFSNYNMAFTAIWLSTRYIEDETTRARLQLALADTLYQTPRDAQFQPIETKTSLFDFIYAAGEAGSRASVPTISRALDQAAIDRGLETLREYPDPPYWDVTRTNCDAAEVQSGHCTLDDGTDVTLLGEIGRGTLLIASTPIPMRVRPPSNYHWRSNPYAPNGGGDGSRLLPGVDFRAAYWLGRWVRVDVSE